MQEPNLDHMAKAKYLKARIQRLEQTIADLEKLLALKEKQIQTLERIALEQRLQNVLPFGTIGPPFLTPLVEIPGCQHDFSWGYEVGDFIGPPRCKKCGAMGAPAEPIITVSQVRNPVA